MTKSAYKSLSRLVHGTSRRPTTRIILVAVGLRTGHGWRICQFEVDVRAVWAVAVDAAQGRDFRAAVKRRKLLKSSDAVDGSLVVLVKLRHNF